MLRVLQVVPQGSRWAVLCTGIVVSLGIGLAGCHAKQALTPQEAEGKHFYLVRCAHCHEENNLALKKAPPDLHGLFKRTSLASGTPASDEQVRRVVLGGKGMMPAFTGRFTEEQMEALLAYLHTGLR